MLTLVILTSSIAPMLAPEEPAIVARPVVGLTDAIAPYAAARARAPRGGMYSRLGFGAAQAADSPGQGTVDVQYDSGYFLGASLGNRFAFGHTPLSLDVEVEGVWTEQNTTNSSPNQAVEKLKLAGVMINALLEVEIVERLSCYVGGGVGAAWLDVKTNDDGGNDFANVDRPYIAWQGLTGVQWEFTPGISADLGLRLIGVDDAQVKDNAGTETFDLQTAQLIAEVGLRFAL